MKILSRLPWWRRLARATGSRLFHWAENNGRADFARNGEGWLLDALMTDWARDTRVRVVIDAGANVGDYTAAVLAAAQRRHTPLNIRAFDPSRQCIARLQQRFAEEASVRIVGAALGDTPGSFQLFTPAAGSTLASLVARPDYRGASDEMVDVVRLDDYLATAGVAHVDLLKLDIEGAELAALRGLGQCLNPVRVAMIQFEYGGTTLDARVSLGDMFSLLEDRGYRVAKLLPQAIEPRTYTPWMDHFTYANFVAFGNTMRAR